MQAEVLYWHPNVEGLSYAIESRAPTAVAGKNCYFPFEWDVGFNLQLGTHLPRDEWDILVQFTGLQTHADALKTAPVLFSPWLASRPSFFATKAKAHWRLHLGVADLLLQAPCFQSLRFFIQAQLALRYGSIRQKFSSQYSGGNIVTAEPIFIDTKNKFWGIGPYIGTIVNYKLAPPIALFIQGGCALLYGEFYIHQDERNDVHGTKNSKVFSIYRMSSPLLELSSGIKIFFNRFQLELAWDQRLLFSQNQLARFLSSSALSIIGVNQGNITLFGVHLGCVYTF